ncbi:MAG: phosphoglucosamine mutase [Ignavibacteriales bacterium]|nr:phosphoglucosamine mutase [Ignavibacteriales bacterium]
MSLMVSISGVRGVVGSGLTPDVVVRYASAFAEYCGRGPIVIGRDGRITGKPIAHIVSSTLLSAGCNVIALGICPTPTIQIAVEKLKAAGGISITASHNPIQWNGLKFLDKTGMFLDARQNGQLVTLAQNDQRSYVAWDKLGRHQENTTFLQKHIDAVLEIPTIDLQLVRKRRFKVVADCVNAAGGTVVPELLKAFGCRVIQMNCDVSGVFVHNPEPLPEHLTALRNRVRREKADLGVAIDPDGDRLVLIDEKGQPFGEEYTIVQAAKFVLEKERKKRRKAAPSVVVNLSTTRAVEDIAEQYGAHTIRTPVGEIHVAAKMKEVGAVIGGEGSGGIILPSVHLGRDALVGIGLTLQHLAEFDGPLSELRKELPHYVMLKNRIEVGSRRPGEIIDLLATRYSGRERVNQDDGIRIDFDKSWVHLRPSNTEPIVRLIAEGPSEQRARQLVDEVMREIGP